MLTDPSLTLADQIVWIVALSLKTLAAEACHRRVGSLSVALWRRVKRFERRFLALYAGWKAGTLPPLRSSASSAVNGLNRGERREAQGEGDAGGGLGDVAPPPPRLVRFAAQSPLRGEGALAAGVLPRGVRWMQMILPLSAGTLASTLSSVLFNHPEMRALAAEAPQVGRLLRPLCKLAGIKPPDYLALPKRKRVWKKETSPRLSAADEEELRRLTARFPDCPPPEIGYGGRSFPPLPKDYVPPTDWE